VPRNPSLPSPAALERARLLLNQGAGLLAQGQAREAIAVLERACRLDAQSAPALINLGGAYIMAGRHKQAIPVLEAARDVEPDNAMVWVNLGAAYLGNPVLATPKQQQRAIDAFRRAIDVDPRSPNVHYNLGLVLVDHGDSEQAADAFRQAIDVNPSDLDARIWLRRLTDPDAGQGVHFSFLDNITSCDLR